MKVVTTDEMRAFEHAANSRGLSYDTMMDRAGRATALAVHTRLKMPPARCLVLVGPGNNGGDGLVAARYLRQWGHDVTVYIWQRDQPEDPHLEEVQKLALPVLRAEQDAEFAQLRAAVRGCDALVDALLGTGVTGPLRGGLRDLLSAVRHELEACARPPEAPLPLRALTDAGEAWPVPHRPQVVALDVPSGLNSDTGEIDERALSADLTVTIAFPKHGLFLFPGAAHVGELMVADIGIASDAVDGVAVELATPERIARLLPPRPLNAHKGTFGRTLIVAGSTHYTGAPCLAAEAAYRSGAGLVTLAVPQAIYPIVAAKVWEATFLVLPDDMGVLVPSAWRVLAERLVGYEALLVGPGLGPEPSTGEFLMALLSGQPYTGRKPIGFEASVPAAEQSIVLPPLVLDADALNLLAPHPRWWEGLPPSTILTPHPGEMARLAQCDIRTVEADRIGMAGRMAQQWGCTVVLKGAYTVVASSAGKTAIIPFANPALATAGTGDVLAGTIAGMLAQGLASADAALVGAYLHALAGEIRRKQLGPVGMVAGDLLPLLPQAIACLRPTA